MKKFMILNYLFYVILNIFLEIFIYLCPIYRIFIIKINVKININFFIFISNFINNIKT